MSRPAHAVINLSHLRHNAEIARQSAPNSQMVAVVKANAYGHGSLAIAQTLEPFADAFAVACIEEARYLRSAGISLPILLLEGVFDPSEIEEAQRHNFWLMLHNPEQVNWVLQAPAANGLGLWLKMDTGMHRLGMTAAEILRGFQQLAEKTPQHKLTLATHFSTADRQDHTYTHQQWSHFSAVKSQLSCLGSAANSAAILAHPQYQCDFIRPGLMLYGCSPFEHAHPIADTLKPVMSLRSAVIAARDVRAGDSVGYGCSWQAQRDSRIATIAVGYGDGYPRHAPQGTDLVIDGHRVPLAGTVSMDMITADITDIAHLDVGAPVELWGEQLSVTELARQCGTISYELLTRMPSRPPRKIVG